MAAAAIETFGGIDILVNNAALMAELPQAPLIEFPLDRGSAPSLSTSPGRCCAAGRASRR